MIYECDTSTVYVERAKVCKLISHGTDWSSLEHGPLRVRNLERRRRTEKSNLKTQALRLGVEKRYALWKRNLLGNTLISVIELGRDGLLAL